TRQARKGATPPTEPSIHLIRGFVTARTAVVGATSTHGATCCDRRRHRDNGGQPEHRAAVRVRLDSARGHNSCLQGITRWVWAGGLSRSHDQAARSRAPIKRSSSCSKYLA